MRKIILGLGLLVSSFCFAQTKEVVSERIITGSLLSEIAGGLNVGANVEWTNKNSNKASFAYAGFTTMGIDVGFDDQGNILHYDGRGFIIGFGFKSYLGKDKKHGWFLQESTDYVQYNYLDSDYKGTYQYISFVNPVLGYKFKFGDFALEPSLGFTWKIEIKGQGDIDNRSFSNTHGKFGLSAGYIF